MAVYCWSDLGAPPQSPELSLTTTYQTMCDRTKALRMSVSETCSVRRRQTNQHLSFEKRIRRSTTNIKTKLSRSKCECFMLSCPYTYLHQPTNTLFLRYRGLHELLGHGCGKLLQETEPGKYNFDVQNPPTSPVTGKKVTTYYKPGETWGSVFGGMGPSYEECRAECVAMSLCPDYSILQIFGIGDGREVSQNQSYTKSGVANTFLSRISTVRQAMSCSFATYRWRELA